MFQQHECLFQRQVTMYVNDKTTFTGVHSYTPVGHQLSAE